MISYETLMTKISESIGQSPIGLKFDSEAFIGDLVHLHTDRDGNIPEPGKLISLLDTLQNDLRSAIYAVYAVENPAPDTDDDSIHAVSEETMARAQSVIDDESIHSLSKEEAQ